MMDLILWRHAEAEDGLMDMSRKLTDKGHKQAAKMAAFLHHHLPADTRILVSPAIRTQQTVAALTSSFTTVPEIAPGASVNSILQAARWPDGYDAKHIDKTRHARLPRLNPLPPAGEGANESLREFHVTAGSAVLVVGHQPTLGAVASRLLGCEHDSLRIKKSGLVWLNFRADYGEVSLRLVITPEFL
jgi:phosphohistidine phosphatase